MAQTQLTKVSHGTSCFLRWGSSAPAGGVAFDEIKERNPAHATKLIEFHQVQATNAPFGTY
jgi:hypothetical protein